MSRADRRAERRRSGYRSVSAGPGGSRRAPATARTRAAARRQQRLAIVLFAVLGLVALAVLATPLVSAPPVK